MMTKKGDKKCVLLGDMIFTREGSLIEKSLQTVV